MSAISINSSYDLSADVARFVNGLNNPGEVDYNSQYQATGSTALDTDTALGNGTGAKQVLVENWQNMPFVFMINTNDELYFGVLYTAQMETGPLQYVEYTAFSGWTYLASSAEQIAVNEWQSHPYLYLIQNDGGLYFGYFYTATTTNPSPPWDSTSYTAFSGWGGLITNAKQGSVGTWQDNPYIFLVLTNNELYYGNLYIASTPYDPNAPWTSTTYTAFSGWTGLITGAKEVTVSTWDNNPYIYLLTTNDNLFFGNLYTESVYNPTPPWNTTTQTAFSGWTGILGGVKD